jgi:DNA polymerase-3 subunit delta
MRFADFRTHKPGTVPNVSVFVCEDDFLVEEARAVWAGLLGGNWVFEKLPLREFEEMESSSLIDRALTPSLFAQNRVLLVANAEKLSKRRIGDLAALQEIPVSSLKVILLCGQRLPEGLAKVFPAVEIDPLRPAEIVQWLIDRHGLAADVARYVVEIAEGDLYTLHNEMEKLRTYAGLDRPIGLADVDASILRAEKFGPFELDDAILARDHRKGLHVLGAMLAEGMEPLVILARIARVWRQLFVGKGIAAAAGAKEAAAAASVPSFKAAEFAAACRKYRWPQLAAGFRYLLDADRAFKTSSPNPEAYLDVLLWKLVGQSPPQVSG